MLQVARLAPSLLSDAAERVAEFLRSQFNEDGGVRDRAGESDLYYTVFGLEGHIALRREVPVEKVRRYLERFGDGEGLDLVHLTCLARSWAALPRGSLEAGIAGRIAARIEAFRAGDGGYCAAPGQAGGTVYHAFLALGALQDLGAAVADPGALAQAVASLQLADGGFANSRGQPEGAATTTAAAVTLLRCLSHPIPEGADRWLLERAHPKGGFTATRGAPIPDLLSTATALHGLAGMKAPLGRIREATLDFLDTLWTGKAFCGSWSDDEPDCEYTYYALLSLGHLSLA
ncbi:MAG: hypothetical protein HY721_32555 [Planctomycetes bacterium]|nr:hypothetical protein [Planctomycetota bacterium]